MKESETIDPELWVMEHMSGDELDRFTNVLETLEKEQSWLDKFHAETDPNSRLADMPVQKKEGLMEHYARWEWALNEKTAIVGKYAGQVQAWAKLIDYSFATIESLFDQGSFDSVADRNEFWRLVYFEILSDRGDEIKKNPEFRKVKILEVLKDYLTDFLPGSIAGKRITPAEFGANPSSKDSDLLRILPGRPCPTAKGLHSRRDVATCYRSCWSVFGRRRLSGLDRQPGDGFRRRRSSLGEDPHRFRR